MNWPNILQHLKVSSRALHTNSRHRLIVWLQSKNLCRKHNIMLSGHSKGLSSYLSSSSTNAFQVSGDKQGTLTHSRILLENFSQNVNTVEQDPSMIVSTLVNFVEAEYIQSMRKFPWLQPINIVAKLQLEIMGKDIEMTAPYLLSDEYKLLIDKVEENYLSFNDLELIRCFEAMMLFFNELTIPMMTKLLCEIIGRIHQFDLRCLADYGACIRHLPKGILFVSLNPICRRFLELLPSVERNMTPEDLYSFANMFRNLHRHCSADLRLRCAETLLFMSREVLQDCSDPEVINAVSYIARRLYVAEGSPHSDYDEINKYSLKVMRFVKAAAVKASDKYDPRHIAEICSSLKITNEYTQGVADVFIDRSMEFLSPDLRLADVSNVFFSLNASISQDTKRKFESILYPKLIEVDPITLSNLTEAYMRINMDNTDMTLRIQQLIVEHIEFLSNAQSKLFFILKFLSRVPKIEDDVQNLMFRSLQSLMKNNQTITSFHSPTISNFCLSCINGRIPDFMFGEIFRSIRHWRINSLKSMLINLSQNRLIHQPQLQIIITEIQNQIYRQVVETPQVIQNVSQLIHLIHLMALHAYYRDNVVTDKLMQLILKFTDQLDKTTLPQVTRLVVILKYYSPDILDTLIKVLLSKANNRVSGGFPLNMWLSVLEACALVGYTPPRMDDFLTQLFEMLNAAGLEGSMDDSSQPTESLLLQELRSMRWLAMLQYYPEDRLAHIFSLDFIEKVDDFLALYPECQQEVEYNMMVLNRTVVLECPQLDVPWFHEAYCRKHVSTDECLGNYKHEILRESIHACLQEALGGDEYIRTRTFSPYYYVIDFECLLDEDNNPVSYSSQDDINMDEYQRVAVIPFTSDFCYNTERLVNLQSIKLRHLQMMGYKIVQIPYYTWYSMGLAEQDSKVNLLKERILA